MRLIDAEPLEEILRSRCAQCSDDHGSLSGAISGCLKLVRMQPTITPPPNDPLTLEQLREMAGEPVWLSGDELNRYDIFRGERSPGWADFYCGRFRFFCYGKDYLAYRRKPEEGTV